jgi:hypothetical protein
MKFQGNIEIIFLFFLVIRKSPKFLKIDFENKNILPSLWSQEKNQLSPDSKHVGGL